MVSLKLDKEKNEWREIVDGETADLVIDGFLKKKLDNGLILQSKNWDFPFVIVGEEGSGKSTLAFICGQYLTKMGLKPENVGKGNDDIIEKLEKIPNGSLLIGDEGDMLFNSRETMSKEQRKLTKIMKIIRQKNLIFIIVAPVFFDLSKYIAVDRSKFLLRTYVDHNFNRGFFTYWGKRKKIKLYHEGKKLHGSYAKPKAGFYGRFIDYKLSFDMEYQDIKRKTLTEAFKVEHKDDKWKAQRDKLIIKMRELHPEMSLGEIAALTGLSYASIAQVLMVNKAISLVN